MHGRYDCAAGGVTTSTVPLMPGAWKPGSEFNTPLMCPIPDWCIGGSFENGSSICAPGHDPAYPYCSVSHFLKETALLSSSSHRALVPSSTRALPRPLLPSSPRALTPSFPRRPLNSLL